MYVAHILALEGENTKALELVNEAAAKRRDDTLVHAAGKTRTGTIYLRGLAYLKAGRASEAAGEFQRVLGLNYYAPGDVLMPFARLGLARAYVLEGDSAKAKSTYQDLLAFWKDADPDLPVVKQTQAEYAKLQ